MKMSEVFEKSPQDDGGINRLEYVLKNSRALNVYGALKELNIAQGQIRELVEALELAFNGAEFLTGGEMEEIKKVLAKAMVVGS